MSPRRGLAGTRLSLALLSPAVWLLSACAHDYRPPGRHEPHASLEIRLSYHAWPGPLLEQAVTIEGDDLRDMPQPAPQAAGGVAVRPVLVRPGPLGCMVRATFFHNDVTTHAETYETAEEAPCGSSTCMQVRPHTRLVNHTDRMDDASCTQGTRVEAKAGERYVLQFDFNADRQCTLKCLRRVAKQRGGSGTVPCDDSPTPHKRH